jgi:hypothetical protein
VASDRASPRGHGSGPAAHVKGMMSAPPFSPTIHRPTLMGTARAFASRHLSLSFFLTGHTLIKVSFNNDFFKLKIKLFLFSFFLVEKFYWLSANRLR